ncbi:hypothetical protein BAUCODRAFT_51010, partial [Baudoinia panamericana UAMH 10762]
RSPSLTYSEPPIASAPGPRATALQKLFSDAVAHIIKTCSYANFAACFPTPSREVPGSMKLLHAQFTEKLGQQLRQNFEHTLGVRGVVRSLNALDGMVEDARRRRDGAVGGVPVPPHTLAPQTLYLAHLAPQLAIYSQDIRSQQQQVQAENFELLARVQWQRKDISALMAGLEAAVADLDNSVAALG